jgi:hypothetical protein
MARRRRKWLSEIVRRVMLPAVVLAAVVALVVKGSLWIRVWVNTRRVEDRHPVIFNVTVPSSPSGPRATRRLVENVAGGLIVLMLTALPTILPHNQLNPTYATDPDIAQINQIKAELGSPPLSPYGHWEAIGDNGRMWVEPAWPF